MQRFQNFGLLSTLALAACSSTPSPGPALAGRPRQRRDGGLACQQLAEARVFYAEALANGVTFEGEPGTRPHYGDLPDNPAEPI